MVCSTPAVFCLMIGAASLSFLAAYYFAKTQIESLKSQNEKMRTTVINLQYAQAAATKELLERNEQAPTSRGFDVLAEENALLKAAIERLENDNRLLVNAYKSLEERLVREESED